MNFKNFRNDLILKALDFKTVNIESGVKNPIQRTTFYLQRRSGARVMVGLVSEMSCAHEDDTRLYQAMASVVAIGDVLWP